MAGYEAKFIAGIMVANIQTLRFLAAAAVVYYHTGFGIFGVETEFGAVPVFFCISGYIMTMITRKRSDGFLVRRIVRIAPMYWLLTLAYWSLITIPLVVRPRELAITQPDLVIKSLLFVPYRNVAGNMQPVLDVGWTLNYEMYFYAVFAACLLISRKWAPVVCGSTILVATIALSRFPNDLAQFYAGHHVLYFVAGIVIFYAAEVIPATKATVWAAAAVAAAYFLQGFWLPYVQFSPAALVLAALILEKAGLRSDYKPLMLLGAASYAIYLGHFLVLTLYRMIAPKVGFPEFETDLPAAIFVTAVSIFFGVLLHLKFEVPVTAWFNSRWRVRREIRLGY